MNAKILYVEDEPLNVRLVQKMLKFSGYDVLVAETAEAGLRLAMWENPDLILMDVNLPDVDGLEATRRIKSMPNLKHIPIVALTANNMWKDREEALEAGCDGYLAKPVSRVELLKTVQQFINYLHPIDDNNFPS